MAFVEFADVSKIYQMGEVKVAAVRDMSFTIEQGEFVVIVGPSGAGKTTLLNMLGRHGLGHLRHHHAGWRACELVQPASSSRSTAATTSASSSSSTTWCRT